MSVDREGWNLENVDHDDASRFVANARQTFEFFECMRNFSVEFFDECLRELKDVHALGVKESAGLDDFGNAVDTEFEHFLRRIGKLEKFSGNLIYADVGALGAQHDRDKHREGVRVI